jgi:uncharacterized protein (TIGR02646 family)
MMPFPRSAEPECLKLKQSWTQLKGSICYQAVRAELEKVSGVRCAFCDGFLRETSSSTVEHFRPKSKFPNLEIQWDNLFPCCSFCQSAKLDRFDELLLKPDAAEYQFLNYFLCNYQTGDIEPNLTKDQYQQARADYTINLYKLNSPERCEARKRAKRKFDASCSLEDEQYRFFLVDYLAASAESDA